MNARIRKELRIQLPALLCGALLYAFPFLWIQEVLLVWLLLVHIIACALVATSSIGNDLSLSVVEAEMALPVPRASRWHERTAVTAPMLAVLTAIYSTIVIWAPHGFEPDHELYAPLVAAGFMIPLMIGALGPEITLAIGEARAGLIVTVLTGAAFSTFIWKWSGPAESVKETVPLILAGSLVSVIAMTCGQRRFLRWQSYNPLTAPFTGLPFKAVSTSRRAARRMGESSWFLLVQELRLQQVNLIAFAAILVFASLLRTSGDWHDLASVAWTIIWPFPVFVGLASVSEERRLGIHNQRLTLPASPAKQWLIKFAANTAIAVVVGLGTLLALDLLDFSVAKISPFRAIPLFLGAAVGGVLLGMAASSLATNYLTSLGTLVALITVWSLGAYPLARALPDYNYVSSDKIFQLVWTPVFILSLALPGYRAFRADEPFGRRLRGFAIAIAISVPASLAIAAALYFRMWEPFLFTMPPAGPAVFTTNSPSLLTQRSGGFYVSEEGELLSSRIKTSYTRRGRKYFSREGFLPLKHPLRITPGNDWKQVVGNVIDDSFIALKTDGTLWYQGLEAWQEMKRRNADPEIWRGRFAFPTNLTQFGTNSDWISISGTKSRFAGIREVGSLWQWGTTGGGKFGFLERHPQSSTNRLAPLETIHTPQRVGTNNHWKAVQIGYLHSFALDLEGRIWEWGNTNYVAYVREKNGGETNLAHYVVATPIPAARFAKVRARRFVGDFMMELTDGHFVESTQGLWESSPKYIEAGLILQHPEHPELLILNDRFHPSLIKMGLTSPAIGRFNQLIDPQTLTVIDPTPTWIDQIGVGGAYYLRTDASVWRHTSFHFTPQHLLNRYSQRAGNIAWEHRPAILPPFRLHRIGGLSLTVDDTLMNRSEHE